MFSFNSAVEELSRDINVSAINDSLDKYQMDTSSNTRRALKLGLYYRKDKTSTSIDIKVNNYPNCVEEYDTNTGLSWKQNKGIANMTLSGKSVQPKMCLISNDNTTSFIDLIHILKFYFGLNELKMNLTGNNETLLVEKLTREDHTCDSRVCIIEKDFTQNILTTTTDDADKNIFISFDKSSPTKWVRLKFISVELDNIDFDNNLVTGVKIKLIIDGMYLPRLCIETNNDGCQTDSLLIWNEKDLSVDYLDQAERFNSCRHLRLIRKHNSINYLVKLIASNDNNKTGFISKSFDQSVLSDFKNKDYLYFSYTNQLYKITDKSFTNDILRIETKGSYFGKSI